MSKHIYECPACNHATIVDTENPLQQSCPRCPHHDCQLEPIETKTTATEARVELAKWVIQQSDPKSAGPAVKRAWEIIKDALGPSTNCENTPT